MTVLHAGIATFLGAPVVSPASTALSIRPAARTMPRSGLGDRADCRDPECPLIRRTLPSAKMRTTPLLVGI